MKTYFCKLRGPRPTFPQDMTPAEAQAMQRHAAYWRSCMEKGGVVAFGPVADPAGTYGMLILEVEDEAAAQSLVQADPVIVAKIGFRFEMHPMPHGAVHPPFRLTAS
jgi:uncharacterized protein YciI